METCSTRQKNLRFGIYGIKHQRYLIICHGLPVYGAFLSSHGKEDKGYYLQGSIPKDNAFFLPLENLLDQQEVRDQMMFHPKVSPGHLEYYLNPETMALTPSYIFRVQRSDLTVWDYIIDAATGEQLNQVPKFFHLTEGYAFLENPIESPLERVNLVNLLETSNVLTGENFTIFGADESTDRAESQENLFDYQPEDQEFFDQVQAYFSLERARSFFSQYFDLSADENITVYTHAYFENNAMYFPADGDLPPAIYIGEPDGTFMTNLNRDSDVAIHEYSHHIVFRFLKTTWGESLVLHEGTADFFAYVINNDPHLAESVVLGKPYLRSADIQEDQKFDQEAQYRGSHVTGQFWSALLWRLYQDLGEPGLRLISDSLNYWPENGDIKDALTALILADEDSNQGNNQCRILEHALNLGFYNALRTFSLTACNLNHLDAVPASASSPSSDPLSLNTCGTIGSKGMGTSFILLFLPLLLCLRRHDY